MTDWRPIEDFERPRGFSERSDLMIVARLWYPDVETYGPDEDIPEPEVTVAIGAYCHSDKGWQVNILTAIPGAWGTAGGCIPLAFEPTHFLPLPPPPKDGEG